jgi:hypothetical protein
MRHVGVREFRDKATKYLAGDEPLAIERHGKPVGYYIPAPPDVASSSASDEEFRQAVDRFEEAVQRILDATGMTREELADLLDLSKPMPDATHR